MARKNKRRQTLGFQGYNAGKGKPAALTPVFISRPAGTRVVYSNSRSVFVPIREFASVPSGRVPAGRHDGQSFGGKISHHNNTAGDAFRRGAQLPKRGALKGSRKLKEPAKQSLKTRDVLKCKPRPNSKQARKGSGGSKAFVPWC